MKTPFIWLCVASILLSGCRSEPPEPHEPGIIGLRSAKSIDLIKDSIPCGEGWKVFTVHGLQILVGVYKHPAGGGESRIDVYGFVYNKSFQEWRRFCFVKTRNLYDAEMSIDEDQGVLYLVATGNTTLNGRRVLQIDARMLSDF